MRHEWHTNYNTFVVIVPGRENCSENCTAAALIDGVGLLLRDTVWRVSTFKLVNCLRFVTIESAALRVLSKTRKIMTANWWWVIMGLEQLVWYPERQKISVFCRIFRRWWGNQRQLGSSSERCVTLCKSTRGKQQLFAAGIINSGIPSCSSVQH